MSLHVWAPRDTPDLSRRYRRLCKAIHGQPVYVGLMFRNWLEVLVQQAEAKCKREGIPLPPDDPAPGTPFAGVPERAQIDVDE